MGKGIISISGIVLRETLLLPDDFEIQHVSYDAWPERIHILVESKDIPAVQKGVPYPQITPIYESETIRHNKLKEIRVEEQDGADRP